MVYKLKASLQIYLLQDNSLFDFSLTLITFILLIGIIALSAYIIYSYFKNYLINQASIQIHIFMVIVLGLIACTYYTHDNCNPVSLAEIYKNITLRTEEKFFILHFNPNTEPIVYDNDGNLIRLNGTELLLPVSEDKVENLNYLKVREYFADIKPELMVKLEAKVTEKYEELTETLIVEITELERVFNDADS